MSATKVVFKLIQAVAPTIAVQQIYRFMSTPKVRKLRQSEEAILTTARQTTVNYKQAPVQKYEWGNAGDKIALLVHGWEGRAGNFAALIPTLLGAGYQVIAYDAPAHGKSAKTATDMFALADFLASELIHFRPDLIISHSFGSVNTARLLRQNKGMAVAAWLLVTTPYDFNERINAMAEFFGLTDKIVRELIMLIEAKTNEPVADLNMVTYCEDMPNVTRAVIIHGKSDTVLPIEGARKVHRAFKQSALIELDSVGHYSILWSEELKKIVKDELATQAVNAGS